MLVPSLKISGLSPLSPLSPLLPAPVLGFLVSFSQLKTPGWNNTTKVQAGEIKLFFIVIAIAFSVNLSTIYFSISQVLSLRPYRYPKWLPYQGQHLWSEIGRECPTVVSALREGLDKKNILFIVNFIDGIVADKVSENYIYWKSFECFHCYEHKKLLTNSSKSNVKTNHSYILFRFVFCWTFGSTILINECDGSIFILNSGFKENDIICDSYI